MKESIGAHLNHSKEGYSTPFATRFAREQTGLRTWDDDPEEVVLPPNFSIQSQYRNWVGTRGWKATMENNAKTQYKKTPDYDE